MNRVSPSLGKIDHIITGLQTGGAEMALYNLLRNGIAERFDCRVISLKGEGTLGAKIQTLDVPVIPLGIKGRIPSYSVLKKFREIIKDQQPDLIQGWMYQGNIFASLSAGVIKNRFPVVWNIRHSLDDLKSENKSTLYAIRINKLLSPYVKAIIYNSKRSKIEHENYGISERSSLVIPNGIDTMRFKIRRENRILIRKEHNISNTAFVIGHIARYHPTKNHDLFMKAALNVLSMSKEIIFILVGRDVSDENSYLKRNIPKEYLSRFRFLGERQDIPAIMNSLDIFCLSSSSEGWPNVLGEALACGIPCVATDVGDSKSIIDGYGLVVPPNNVDHLTLGLIKMISMPKTQLEELGRLGRKYIVENFEIKYIVEKYSSLYRDLINLNR